jgi:hypothetical protein
MVATTPRYHPNDEDLFVGNPERLKNAWGRFPHPSLLRMTARILTGILETGD